MHVLNWLLRTALKAEPTNARVAIALSDVLSATLDFITTRGGAAAAVDDDQARRSEVEKVGGMGSTSTAAALHLELHAVIPGVVEELQRLLRVRADIIGHARIKYVGKYQSCMF